MQRVAIASSTTDCHAYPARRSFRKTHDAWRKRWAWLEGMPSRTSTLVPEATAALRKMSNVISGWLDS